MDPTGGSTPFRGPCPTPGLGYLLLAGRRGELTAPDRAVGAGALLLAALGGRRAALFGGVPVLLAGYIRSAERVRRAAQERARETERTRPSPNGEPGWASAPRSPANCTTWSPDSPNRVRLAVLAIQQGLA
ncbi:hypothetical protein ACH4E7_09640 [Kitasatospora sp. NPDC018058]|uniref:hypothetical protein n=1 Tax=Kitasatospora sp. NPDC018058 TaxID=3364025 RepID=UPI0037BFFC2A